MRRFKGWSLIIMILMGFAIVSCEKVIDINLKDAKSIIVIEGVVTNSTDSQFVKINRSVPFGESNIFPPVTSAKVTIIDNTNRTFILPEKRPGFYMLRGFTGRVGRTYNLKVEADGIIYTASSTMPDQVVADSVGLISSTFLNGDEQKTIQLQFNDPPVNKNYYRFLLKINGKYSKNIFVYNDNFSNGKRTGRELFDFDLNAKPGDKAEIEMHCIDSRVYHYWLGLEQNGNRGGASTTPANPESNISNGALGYFSAHTRQVQTLTVP